MDHGDLSWRLEYYEDPTGHCPFTTFVDDLAEPEFAAMDAALRLVLARLGIELLRTEWLKPLGEGLHEFRVRHDAAEIAERYGESAPKAGSADVLLRAFVHFHGERIVLLLAGYDKGDDPSKKRQQREITRARKLLTAWREQQARDRAAGRKRK